MRGDESLDLARATRQLRRGLTNVDFGASFACFRSYATKPLNALAQRLQRALEIVQRRRQATVEAALAAVADRTEELYRRIHPDEPLGNVVFVLDPDRRASLDLKSRFYGADVPPQAVFSESHLDTLGVCIFLALAERFGKPRTLVVLDDVLTSVDQAHLTRFINLLHDEFSGGGGKPQIVVTTHYRPWRERYRYNYVPSNKIQLVDLRPWSLAGGISHEKGRTKLDDLEARLASGAPDPQELAGLAGVVLEATLSVLAEHYQCKLPYIPDNRYTIGQLLDGIDKVLRTKLSSAPAANPTAGVALGPLLGDIKDWAWVRNQVGAHFSLAGWGVGEQDVREFAGAVRVLVRAVTCSGCGSLTHRPKPTGLHCGCSALVLAPVPMTASR